MDMQLKGKTALVTASTAGIGRAIAEGLLKEGTRVIINGTSEERVSKVLEELRSQYKNVEGVAADLGSAEGCGKLINQILEPLDILINNLGIYEIVDFFDTNEALWEKFFEVNIMSGVRLSRHYLKPMLEKGWGRILFISSESGLNIPEDMIHYGMTKTAQLAIMRGLAKLTRGTDVTVNALLPGPTRTRGVEELIEKMAKDQDVPKEEVEKNFVGENRPTSLIQRLAESEEVAPMAVLLCSPLSSATNGSSAKVEGGIVNQIM